MHTVAVGLVLWVRHVAVGSRTTTIRRGVVILLIYSDAWF